MSSGLKLVRPDAKGRVRHLLKEAQLFDNLLPWISELAEGKGEFPFTEESAMAAD